MTTTTFDTLGYYEKLKAAGFTEAQAKVQVEAMQGVVKSYDEASRKELATKRMSGIHLAIPVFSKGYRQKQGKVVP